MKKTIVITVSVLLALIIGLFFAINALAPKNFSDAKRSAERYLKRNQAELEDLAVSAVSENKKTSGYYDGHYYSFSPEQGVFEIDIDAQGFLGGQYWGLAYTPDGTFHGETQEYSSKETNGNNIFRAERIGEHWWFTWIDYDGTERSYK